jgi:hypothetical protein
MIPRLCAYTLLVCLLAWFRGNAFESVTEVLKNPAGNEDTIPGGKSHEFIEITNIGDVTLTIDSMFLFDGGEIDSIVPWRDTLPQLRSCLLDARIIAPGRTALVLDRDYALAPKASWFVIDSGTIILTTNDADLGNSLAEDDGVLIYKGTKTRIDRVVSFVADPGQQPSLGVTKIHHMTGRNVAEGYSVIPRQVLFANAEWLQCPDSLSPGHYEYVKNGWLAEYRLGTADASRQTLPCSLACWKIGGCAGAPATWSVESAKSTVSAARTLDCSAGPMRTAVDLPLDSTLYSLRITDGGAVMAWDIDISTEWAPLSAIRITEVFPRATTDEPEWFEVANVSSMPINLKGWRFGTGEDSMVLSDADVVVRPSEFRVIARDRALFLRRYPLPAGLVTAPGAWVTLDNYDDTLRLWNNRGNLQEAVCWHNEWFASWKAGSLERVSTDRSGLDKNAWAVAVNPSPGMPNGSTAWRSAAQATVDIGPAPFTPNGDGRDDYLAITLSLPAAATASIAIYGFDGRKIRDLPGPAQQTYRWDGRADDGRPALPGPFFVVVRIQDDRGVHTIRKKGVLWR